MALADLKQDLASHRERLSKLKLDGMAPEKFAAVMKMELVENVFPLFEALVESIEDEVLVQVDELGQAVDELIDQSEDVLHPETAAQILGVLEVGNLIAKELESALARLKELEADDELERKRATDLIIAYRQAHPIIEGMIGQITLDPSEDQPSNGVSGAGVPDDGGDEDQDDDEDDDQESDRG